MNLSKKIRFEVFKRDGFSCCYCGKTPPQTTLEIDHIIPISKGGDHNLNNLLVSCFDCNRGKSNIELTRVPSKISRNFKILKEKELQIKAYKKFILKINDRINSEILEIESIFQLTFPKRRFSDNFKFISTKRFLEKLPLETLKDSMNYACARIKKPEDAIRYFCGICWKKIKSVNING